MLFSRLLVVLLPVISTVSANAGYQSLAGPSSVPTVTLSNVQGSYYSQSNNGLYTVDAGTGYLGFTPLVPSAVSPATSYSGVSFPPGNAYDFGTGVVSGGGFVGYDDGTKNFYPSAGIYPRANSELVYLGVLSTTAFANIDQGYLTSNALWQQYQLDANPFVNNVIQPILPGVPPVNAVFAVFNTWAASGVWTFAKFQVTAVGSGNVLTISSTAYVVNPRYIQLGSGYSAPQHITLSSNGKVAYISEGSTGAILSIPVGTAANSMNRASATVLATVNSPRQLSLDETTNSLYVIESISGGSIKRIDLSGVNPVSNVASGFNGGIGLLSTSDRSTFYVSQRGGAFPTIVKVATSTGIITPVINNGGLTAPSFLNWVDATQQAILIPQTSAQSLTILALQLSNGVAFQFFIPNQVNVADIQYTSNGVYTVTSQNEIALYNVAPFQFNGPLLMGIGAVPISAITNGLATTAPGYQLLQVTNSPFGGSLAIMINHDYARQLGYNKYTLSIDTTSNIQTDPWGDYLWNPYNNQFVYTQASTVAALYNSPTGFAVRNAGDIWYNYWLGGYLNTGGLSNGIHTLSVTFWSATPTCRIILGQVHCSVSSTTSSVQVIIDNTWPTAIINGIDYYPNWVNDSSIGTPQIVPTCGIVQGTSDAFSFNITASDADQHLLSWSLSSVWGNNQGAGIVSDTYSNHAGSTLWAGVANTLEPITPPVWHATVPGDTSSYQCAHTFYLNVWDRTINGYSYIHYAGYTRSITLLLSQ